MSDKSVIKSIRIPAITYQDMLDEATRAGGLSFTAYLLLAHKHYRETVSNICPCCGRERSASQKKVAKP